MAERTAATPRIAPAVRALAALALVVCVAASLLLVLEHLAGLQLPGCGSGSPCARASESIWGKVPYVNWPVSFLGLAYFLGLLVAWLVARDGLPPAVRWVIRLGMLLSAGFTLIMFLGGYLCPYCVATHIGNLLFWLFMELGTRGAALDRRPLTALAAVFVACSLVLGAVEWQGRATARATAETQAQASETAILAASTQPTARDSDENELGTVPRFSTTGDAATAETQPSNRGFTGRWRLGPEAAPIRIVLFMDYQCKGCHIMELELKQILEQHPEVSLSVKHWPGGAECNPNQAEHEHVYSCADARAAEAAGILHGNDGFWQLHFWLFHINGRATDDDFHAACAEFGWDPGDFDRVRNSDEVRQRVAADITEGFDLGLSSTPMIFVNGIEFKGWSAPLALSRVVDAISKKGLPAKAATEDHPLPAREAFLSEFRQAKVRTLPATQHAWSRGPETAKVKIVAWGDYQQPNSALADQIIREFSATRGDVQYTFHPFPLQQACNAGAKDDDNYPLSCRAAQAAQAAGVLGGADAYWKMHEWLLQHQAEFSDDTLRAATVEMGLDPAALLTKMDDPAIATAIAEEAQAGTDAGLQHSPLMFLNGKVVPRWMHGKEPLLRAILEAAAGN